MHFVDYQRLAIYKKILALPVDPTIKDRIGHRVTAPIKLQTKKIERLKTQFIAHLMHRELGHKGDL
jgi:hypothetical protein